MKKKTLFHRFKRDLAVIILSGALLLSGCASSGDVTSESGSSAAVVDGAGTQVQTTTYVTSSGPAEVTTINVSDMFSDRDLKEEYDASECIKITLNGKEASCESSAVSIADHVVSIKEAGTYLLSGSYEGSIRVEAPEDAKVQLILDGVEITTDATAAIYVKTADKVFLTMAKDSNNKITNRGEFAVIDDNNVDGAIFSKSDLTLNGSGTLTVTSEKGHGIVSKDDLKVTGGTYVITAGDHGISGKDSIRIANGTFTITSTEDGLHSGNDEDAEKGYVYIANGNFTISCGDDAIHGESKVVIADGTIRIEKCTEGIEAAIVEIAGGDVSVVASDDGINASDGSGEESFGRPGGFSRGSKEGTETKSDVYILISGGKIVVDAQGDGIDSNGDVYVTGGETYVSGPEGEMNGALDYDGTGKITGGSFIAIGSTGMAMNFNSATQGSAILSASSSHKAGELVQLKDSSGNVLVSITSTRQFASVVVSSPLMKQGETYTLCIGSETKEFTLEQLTYGQSGGFGGGMGGPGGFGGRGRGGNSEGNPDGMPQMPEGFDGNFDGMPQMPEGFDGSFDGMPQMPEGFDGSFDGMPQMPEGFEGMPQRPGSRDGSSGGKSGGKSGSSTEEEGKTGTQS